MKEPKPNKPPSGLKVGKPINQFRLKSMLNIAKENPIPIEHMPMAKSGGSALKMPKGVAVPKAKYTAATNFKP